MCLTCGCGSDDAQGDGREKPVEHEHVSADGVVYRHVHHHSHHGHDHGAEGAASRELRVERAILEKNDAIAAENRRRFEKDGVLALNLVSSPGSGKTSLLVRTVGALRMETAPAVIEGDQQTSLDAERIRGAGARAVQINTGKACHLDARMVRRALDELAPAPDSILFIENVGNLVCPAAFDLGERCKVVILSVTEGEDKPLKYPDMFRAARLMLINKCDLLPHLDFDVNRVIENARRINPSLEVLQVSARTGEGLGDWLDWLRHEHAAMGSGETMLVAPG